MEYLVGLTLLLVAACAATIAGFDRMFKFRTMNDGPQIDLQFGIAIRQIYFGSCFPALAMQGLRPDERLGRALGESSASRKL